MKTPAVVLGAALLLAGCGHSPPTRFFVLDPSPAGRPPSAAAIAPVQLGAVHIPEILDRPEVVSQSASNRLMVDDQDQWGAPLDDMMRRVLAQDLLERLPPGSFVPPGAPRPDGVRALVVNVLSLKADASGRVTLQASWSLMAGHPARTVARHDVRLATDAHIPGAAGQAAAISDLLGEMADGIVAGLTP